MNAEELLIQDGTKREAVERVHDRLVHVLVILVFNLTI